MMASPVGVVLVNWNGKADTLECLASLRQDTYPNKRLIVVDNGSQDDSVAAIQAEFPDTVIVELGANLGFTGGNNAGIRDALDADMEFILLLNNDTIVEPDALDALVEAAHKHPEVGIFTPVIHYYDDRSHVWLAGTKMDITRGIAAHDNSRVPGRDEAPVEIPWASGCAMLIRAEIVRMVGGLDDRYFIYWEDVDYCLRTRAAGWTIALVPAARIYHKISQCFQSASATSWHYQVRNHLLCLDTHAGSARTQAKRCAIRWYLRECRHHFKQRRQGANPLAPTLHALWDHCTRRYGRLRTPHPR
jgi:GT2 family glycosyltransferase